ncbi:rhomboid family intramembrane serine protease [Natranaerofaba carboxydovora]|uniref:rhomboid family intramembrane serine protease n=1 Tax=Natranaerofaba carboxydovora TaxID=2742683 RepID=UPI001F145EEF|nr:rhomboid family intramembrane serine protease [Natranaerofaba carboxydovora]UMZ73185.1 Rhomboid protease GluP [Natranaerofaba carboxydovora]
MIPLKDNIKSKSFPLVTIFLILMNVSIFAFQFLLDFELEILLINVLGFVPHRISLDLSLYPLVTFVTSTFLHGSLLHLLGNMLYLWIFGDNVEDRLGKFGFLFFYIVVGVIGNIAHYLYNPLSTQPAIGASGAVAGILGAYFVFYPYAKILTLIPLGFFITAFHVPAVLFLGIWILLQTINALLTLPGAAISIAWWAHIGGFMGGFFLGILNSISKS